MAHIEIEFFPGGAVKIMPRGFPGASCYDATRPYEAVLTAHTRTSAPTQELEAAAPVTAAQTQKAAT